MLLFELWLVLLSILGAAARVKFSVGALFEQEHDEMEIAFLTAIDRANIHERNFELVPIIGYVSSEDSFQVEKEVCNLISKGVVAIFGPSSEGGKDIVASICHTLNIPHFIVDWSASEALEERQFRTMTLNLHPDTLELARGMAEIVRSFSWRSYTIVYENERDLQQLQDILQIAESGDNPTTMRQLSTDGDYRPFLKSIKMSPDNCLILQCSLENVIPILQQANELKMLGEYQSIFIPLIDTHTIDFQEFQHVSANITTIRLMDPTDYQLQDIAHDWAAHEQREDRFYRVPPERVKTGMVLMNDAVWTLMKGLGETDDVSKIPQPKVKCQKNRHWNFGQQLAETIRMRSEEGASGKINFNHYGQRNFFTLRVMELTSSGFLDLATWNPLDGLDLLGDEDDSNKRVGEKLSNKTFIITSRIGRPFLSLREANEGEVLQGNARYEGYSMDLIDAIAKLLNFKYEFQLAPDGKYGSFNKQTQQWDGLIKQLLDGNADLGICDLTMTSARRQAVDFTPPFMTLGISILYAKAEVPPPNLFSFLSPFSLDVWIYMATAYLGVSLLLFALSRMAPDDWENPHPCKEPEEVENIWSIMNTTWLTMGSIMGQGCDILPKAASTRLVTGMWWFFALMMLNSYTANLAAFLTMSRMDSSIESAEDLAAQSKIKYGAVIGGSTLSFFKESNFSTYQRMWSAMESARPSVFTKSNDEGVDRVLKGKRLYAFLMESTILEYIVERKCELMQVGGWLDYKTYGIAMPFNSPYRKQISGAVLKLGEMGTLAELKRKWWKEMHGAGNCSTTVSGGGDTPELDLENVGGVFLVLGIGLFSAFVLGIVEFLWNVKTVAIEEKISLLEALKLEAKFALQFWIKTKPVHGSSAQSGSSASNSKRSSKSLAISVTHSMKSLKSAGEPSLSIHDKLRKVSSMFSLKSIHSGRNDADHSNGKKESKCNKATQIENELVEQVEASPPHYHSHHHRHHHRHQDQDLV